MRPGIRPNPKKDRSAQRKRPEGTRFLPKFRIEAKMHACKECSLRSRENGSSRCEQCKNEYHE